MTILLTSPYRVLTTAERLQLVGLHNVLLLVEHTLKKETVNFADFCTQMRGRMLGEPEGSLLYKLRLDITTYRRTFFKSFHPSLKENNRLESLVKVPHSVIHCAYLFPDQHRIAFTTDSGLLFVYSFFLGRVTHIFTMQYVELTSLKALKTLGMRSNPKDQEFFKDEEYFFVGGNDPCIRKMSLTTMDEVARITAHSKPCKGFSLLDTRYLYSYGVDKKLVRVDLASDEVDCSYQAESHISRMKLVKKKDAMDRSRVVVTLADGYIELLDWKLEVLKSVEVARPNEKVISITAISSSEFLTLSKDG